MNPADKHQDLGPDPAETRDHITASPDGFRLHGDLPRVMRLSRKTLASIGVVASLAIGGSLIYALQPKASGISENLYDTEGRNRAEVVTGAPADYGNVPKLGPPLPGDLGGPILAAQKDGQNIPIPALGPPPPVPADPAATAAEQARQRAAQEQESAISSKLFLAGNIAANDPPVAATLPAKPDSSGASQGAATRGRAFLEIASNQMIESTQRITAPSSPYVLQAGSIIPAALITGIRSDLPGQITAQVTQNIYDSPTGRILLIPQGARLIGEYDNDVATGQNRVLLAWDRLILPGGRSILLDRLPGADAAGMAGLQDRTNYHWGNLLRAALISTLLGAGSEIATNDDSDLVRALRSGTQDTIANTGRQVVQRQLSVPPTLMVRPGFALRIIVTRDIILESAGSAR